MSNICPTYGQYTAITYTLRYWQPVIDRVHGPDPGQNPSPRPAPAPAEICPNSAGVLQNIFPKMYIILLENEGF